jgi:hypothetical protein
MSQPKLNQAVSKCKLVRFIRNATGIKPKKIIIETFSGNRETLASDLSKYYLVYKWSNQHIPPSFGGPIQLCSNDSIERCWTALRKLTLKN